MTLLDAFGNPLSVRNLGDGERNGGPQMLDPNASGVKVYACTVPFKAIQMNSGGRLNIDGRPGPQFKMGDWVLFRPNSMLPMIVSNADFRRDFVELPQTPDDCCPHPNEQKAADGLYAAPDAPTQKIEVPKQKEEKLP